jgi:IS30 family transposase
MARQRLPWDIRVKVWDAWSAGAEVQAAAEEAGVPATTARQWVREAGGVRPRAPGPRSPLRLSAAEREEISRGIAAGASLAAVGRRIGRPACTVSREVARNGGRARYRAEAAERRAERLARRPKPAKLAANPALRAVVQARLDRRWSPRQISKRLPLDYPGVPSMRVSHETIYTSLYVPSRGGLDPGLTGRLRTGRRMRRPRRRAAWLKTRHGGRGRIPGMTPLAARPAEAAARATPGHWEGDLILGRGGASAIATLVDRATRFVRLVHLGGGKTAEAVAAALAAEFAGLPVGLRRSLTWDQGAEMTAHAAFTAAVGVPVYFCEPHSPWQRGSNENANGLLRQYFPKGSDLSAHKPADLAAVAAELNGRPRRELGWRSAAEVLDAAGFGRVARDGLEGPPEWASGLDEPPERAA